MSTIYEFRCKNCRAIFDERRPSSERNDVAYCPYCSSSKTSRRISSGITNTPVPGTGKRRWVHELEKRSERVVTNRDT